MPPYSHELDITSGERQISNLETKITILDRLPGGKIRSRKQWDAYQKLVAYYNHQKTVNTEIFDKEHQQPTPDKKQEITNVP